MAASADIIGKLRILVDADTSKAQSAMRKLGGSAGVWGAAIGTSLGVAGVAALRMGDDYHDAMSAIRVGTGATGDQLRALESDFKAAAGGLSESIGSTAQVLANLNTGLGLTGQPLQTLTAQVQKLGRITGMDVAGGTSDIIRLFGDWSVATGDQTAALDQLFRAGQATGAQVDQLARQLVEYGAPLRQLGFTYEQSLAMLGKWQREGVNVEKVTGGMRIALGQLMREGVATEDMAAEFAARMEAIKDGTAGATEAITLFGSRNASDMIAALREGRFEIDEYVDAVVDGSDSIAQAARDTRTFGDTVRETMNKVKLFVGPITDAFAGIAESMGNAIFLLPAMTGAIGNALGRGLGKLRSSAALKAGAAKVGAMVGRMMGMAMMGVQGIQNVIVGSGAWAKIGRLAGSRFGKAFGIAAAAALALIIVDQLAQLGEVRQQNIEKAQANTDAMQDFLATAPSRAEVETKLAGLKAIPENLEGAQEHIYNFADLADGNILGSAVDGLFGTNPAQGLKAQIADLERYLATMPAALEEAAQGVADTAVPVPEVAAAVRQEFVVATAEVAKGFGNIKQALQDPPQMIGKGDRLANMEKRMGKVMRNIKAATKKDDPWSQRYWETARAKLQGQMDKLRGKNTATMTDIKRAYRRAGVSVEGTWAEVKRKTVQASGDAATGSITELQRIEQYLATADMSADGYNMVLTYANGIRAGIPAAATAAAEVNRVVSDYLEANSPTRKGALSRIDQWGGPLIDAWLKPMSRKLGTVAAMGGKLGSALAPQPAMTGMALSTMGMAAGGGGNLTLHIGTLIANEAGLDELERRMQRRHRRADRGRRTNR